MRTGEIPDRASAITVEVGDRYKTEQEMRLSTLLLSHHHKVTYFPLPLRMILSAHSGSRILLRFSRYSMMHMT